MEMEVQTPNATERRTPQRDVRRRQCQRGVGIELRAQTAASRAIRRVDSDQPTNGRDVGCLGPAPLVFLETIGDRPWAAVRFEGLLDRGEVDVVATVQALRAFDFSGVEGLLLHIDSGGGSVRGLSELHTFCGLLGKPVVACVQEMALSGGYWLAVAASTIICSSNTDQVGGAGVMLHFEDDAGFLASHGLVSKDVYSTLSPRKNRWWRLLRQGDEATVQREYLDPCCKEFLLAIHHGRGQRVSPHDTLYQGDQLSAREALARGWIDHVGDYRAILQSIFWGSRGTEKGDNMELNHAEEAGLVANQAVGALMADSDSEPDKTVTRQMEVTPLSTAKAEESEGASGSLGGRAAIRPDEGRTPDTAPQCMPQRGTEQTPHTAARCMPQRGEEREQESLESLKAQVEDLTLELGKMRALVEALGAQNAALKALPAEAGVEAHAQEAEANVAQDLLAYCQAHQDDARACIKAIRGRSVVD